MSRRLAPVLALAVLILIPGALALAASPDASSPAPTAGSMVDASPGATPEGPAEPGAPPGAASIVIPFILIGLGSIPALLAVRRGWRPRPGGF